MMWLHATIIAHSCVHVHVQVLVCTCSSQVQNENNTQYPFYTVAVKHETGEFDTDSLIGGNKSANNKLTSSLLYNIMIKIYMIVHQYNFGTHT